MSKQIIYQPIVTEKAEKAAESLNRYSFWVNKNANKLEIKKAVEEMFGVQVQKVNTCVMPATAKSRFTKAGFVKGKTKVRKKAFVTVSDEDLIDFYEYSTVEQFEEEA